MAHKVRTVLAYFDFIHGHNSCVWVVMILRFVCGGWGGNFHEFQMYIYFKRGGGGGGGHFHWSVSYAYVFQA